MPDCVCSAGAGLRPPLSAGWVRLADFHGYPAFRGSALAVGRCDYEAGQPPPHDIPTNVVWLLHGDCDIGEYNCFERYPIPTPPQNPWALRQRLPWEEPFGLVDWGGALAYVPDPYAAPPGGRLFAFTGRNTPFFWTYNPVTNEWTQMPDLPEDVVVGDGGALCYGGIFELGGVLHALLYAFVGNGSPRFFRYAYPLSPMEGEPAGWGGWTELARMYSNLPVKAGGCLAWCRLPDNVLHPRGLVMALRGDHTQGLYFYDPAQDAWSWPNLLFGPAATGGAAMAAGASGSDIRFWAGGGTRSFMWYTYGEPQVRYCQLPPDPDLKQYEGAALCQVGDTFYAVFGKHNEPFTQFWRYWHWGDEQGGGQGGSFIAAGKPEVRVLSRPGEHRFRVSCAPGPVGLKVFNTAGAVLTRLSATAGPGGADLVWTHTSARAGVYLFEVETPQGRGSGKLTVVR